MKIVALVIITLFLAPTVTAFAVGSDYIENNVLNIEEDTVEVYNIYLQNPSEKDLNVRLRVGSVDGIAQLAPEYELVTVPAGNTNYRVSFNITHPEDAKIGDTFSVDYSAQPQASAGGTLQFSPGISRSFKVTVITNPDKFNLQSAIRTSAPLWILLLVVIGVYMWLKRNEKE